MRFVLLIVFIFSITTFEIHSKVKPKGFLPRTFKADFEQIITSSVSGKQKKSYGIIEYKFKGHLKMEVQRPEETKALFISNPKTTWYYVPPFSKGEKGELSTNKTTKAGHFKFFDMLSRGLISNEKYNVVRNEAGVNLILLKEDAKKMGIKKAILVFKKKKELFNNLDRIQLEKENGSVVIIKLMNVKKNIKFSVNHFIFDKKAHL